MYLPCLKFQDDIVNHYIHFFCFKEPIQNIIPINISKKRELVPLAYYVSIIVNP